MAMLHCRPASVGRLGIDPQLASWDRAGSPSQLRLANFLTHVDVMAAPMIAAIPARRLRDAGGPGIQLRLDELAALKGCLRLPETVRQLERRLARCDPSNRPRAGGTRLGCPQRRPDRLRLDRRHLRRPASNSRAAVGALGTGLGTAAPVRAGGGTAGPRPRIRIPRSRPVAGPGGAARFQIRSAASMRTARRCAGY